MTQPTVESSVMHLPPTVLVAIFGVIGSVIVGFITYFGGRNASVAVLQTALTEGFRELNAQQMERINALQGEINAVETSLSEVRAELAAERQRSAALRNLLRREGIEIPRDTVHVPVFTPYPDPPVVAHPGDIFDATCESETND